MYQHTEHRDKIHKDRTHVTLPQFQTTIAKNCHLIHKHSTVDTCNTPTHCYSSLCSKTCALLLLTLYSFTTHTHRWRTLMTFKVVHR